MSIADGFQNSRTPCEIQWHLILVIRHQCAPVLPADAMHIIDEPLRARARRDERCKQVHQLPTDEAQPLAGRLLHAREHIHLVALSPAAQAALHVCHGQFALEKLKTLGTSGCLPLACARGIRVQICPSLAR